MDQERSQMKKGSSERSYVITVSHKCNCISGNELRLSYGQQHIERGYHEYRLPQLLCDAYIENPICS